MERNWNRKRHLALGIAILVGVICLVSEPASAQLDVQISQHMFNRTYYNPSATGASAYVNAFVLARKQWVNWEGAPETQLASVHSYFPALRSGIGLNLINDNLGLERVQTAKLMYAYHAVLSDKSYLSLGLGAGARHQSIDYSRQVAVNPSDPDLIWADRDKWNPDFDFGLEYNRNKFRLGASVTHLERRSNRDTPLSTGMHFYGHASYTMPVGMRWNVQTALFAQNNQRNTQMEASCIAYYKQAFWLGSALRMDDKRELESAVFMAGMKLLRSLRVGYAFDYNLKLLSGYTGNSHELFIQLQLPNRMGSYSRTPRFFE